MTERTLNVKHVAAIMDRIEEETIDQRLNDIRAEGALASDPILNASREMYNKIREATYLVWHEGVQKIDDAVSRVVTFWEEKNRSLEIGRSNCWRNFKSK